MSPHCGSEASQERRSRVQQAHRPLTSPLTTRGATEPGSSSPQHSARERGERGEAIQYKHSQQLQQPHRDGAASSTPQHPPIDQGLHNITHEAGKAGPGFISTTNTKCKSSPATLVQQNTQTAARNNNNNPHQNIANPQTELAGIVSNESTDCSKSKPGLNTGVKVDTNPDLLDDINISINPSRAAVEEGKPQALKDNTLNKQQTNLKINAPVRLPSASESSTSSGIITSSSGESFGAAFGVVNGSSSGDSLSAASSVPPGGESSCSSTAPSAGGASDNAMNYVIKSGPASSSNDEDPGYASVDEIPLDSPGKVIVHMSGLFHFKVYVTS